MQYKHKVGVFIGRFQPFHNAHMDTVTEALSFCDKLLILVGSSNQPRSIKNPFSFEERVLAMSNAIGQKLGIGLVKERVVFVPVVDFLYDDTTWVMQVMASVYSNGDTDNDSDICLFGLEKDDSSFYMRLFPKWKRHDISLKDTLDATVIRDMYFSKRSLSYLSSVVPPAVLTFLENFKKQHDYSELCREHAFIIDYKKQWAAAPYPVIFVTADAVVVQSGYVLLVKRAAYPGKGLYALPGGFVDAAKDRSVVDCAIRELKEETRIDLPDRVLRGSITTTKVFDAIGRSTRGRTITHATLFQLEDTGTLPKVKGSDDAEVAFWLPIAALDPKRMYEDHYSIIQALM